MDKLPKDINTEPKRAPPPKAKSVGRLLDEAMRRDEALHALAVYFADPTRSINAGMRGDQAFNDARDKLGIRGYASIEEAIAQMKARLAL